MERVNEERKSILKTGNNNIATSAISRSMKETVELFNSRYRDEDFKFNVRAALQDMGLNFKEDSKSNGVFNESDGGISLVTVRPSNSEEATRDLTRYLGVYLFTDIVTMNGDYIDGSTIHHTDEKIVNEFLLLMTLPVKSLDVFTPIEQLIEWSIDYKIPLPVIRTALSL